MQYLKLITLIVTFLAILNFSSTTSISATEVDEPLCYMQTTDGRTINLGNLCNQNQPAVAVNSNPEVKITAVNYHGKTIRGQIINLTTKPVQAVKVNYEVVDNNGNTIDAGYIDVQSPNIPPGGTAFFQENTSYPRARVATTFVSWD